MKTVHLLFSFFFIFAFGCNSDSENGNDENNTEPSDKITVVDEETADPVDQNSVKFKLFGLWEATDDADLRIELNAGKYKTYDQGNQVWDQDWDLTDGPDIETAYKNDNGDHIWVYDQNGNAFYITKIVSLTEDKLTTSDVKGGKGGERSYLKVN